MANTYSQIYIHIVFSVKGRENLIRSIHREELQKYVSGIIKHKEHKLYAIYIQPDHVHMLVSINPIYAVSDLVRDIKANSSRYVNEQKWVNGKFLWQEGYGAFSVSKSQTDVVIQYINNQGEHHKKKTFKEEYYDILNKYEIEYEEKYLFEWYE